MFYKKTFIIPALIFGCSTLAHAKYNRLKNCGQVERVENTNCKDLKVSLSFKGCKNKKPSAVVDNVICGDNIATAVFIDGKYKYEAHLNYVPANGWEGGSWEAVGNLRQWREKAKVAKVQPKPKSLELIPPPKIEKSQASTHIEPERQPAQESATPEALKKVDVNGFVAPVYMWNDQSDNGFKLYDSALTISYSHGKSGLFIDLPITSSSASGGSGTFDLAQERAQGYVTYSPKEWLQFTLGQFDTLYGYELNDSKDRFFVRPGIVYNGALNLVHSGAMVQATFGDATLKILSANQSNRTDLHGNNDPEVGAQASYNLAENTYITLGYLSYRDSTADANNQMTDVLLGTKILNTALDFEYNHRRLTDGTGEARWFLLHALYDQWEQHKIGARFEFGDSVDASTTSQFQHSWAYRYVESEQFWIQLEVQALTTHSNNDVQDTHSGVTLSATHLF